MLPKNRIPSHPGEILRFEFLEPMGLTQSAFASHIGVPLQRVNEIVLGKRGISPETAWLFAQAFGTSAEFWTNLQHTYDLAKFKPTRQITPIQSRVKLPATSR